MSEGVHGVDGKTSLSSTISPTDGVEGGPIIEQTEESEEYQQDLQVVLGTAVGVIIIVALVVVAAVLYRITRNRRRVVYGTSVDSLGFDRQVSIDIGVKSPPLVLILYSPDCPLHTQVVAALAGFLTEVCGVTVTFDLWEEAVVLEQGVDSWLVERLQEADFILVVCSVGARLRCSKKKIHFKTDTTRLLPDYFAVAVDYVAEKLRVERLKGLGSSKFLTVFMEYSTPQDIPHQLEASTQLCLLRDLHSLVAHFSSHHGSDWTKSETGSVESLSRSYLTTEAGQMFQATLEQAKIFFKNNPAWMDGFIEQIEAPFWSLRRSKRKNRRLVERGGKRDGSDVTDSLLSPQVLGQNQPLDSNRNSILPVENGTSHLYKCRLYCLDRPGVFSHSRKNSLPSSLGSNGVLVPPANRVSTSHKSKSLDSVVHSPSHTEANPVSCLFCGDVHPEGRPVCRKRQNQMSDDDLHERSESQVKCGRWHTVLQAEVHQEWGPNSPERRPLGRHSTLQQTTSVPPHSHYTPSLTSPHLYNTDCELLQSRPKVWDSFPSENSLHNTDCDTTSVSDSDSLERDLRSIQHISSFQDFVNSTTFTLGQGYWRMQPVCDHDQIALNTLTLRSQVLREGEGHSGGLEKDYESPGCGTGSRESM